MVSRQERGGSESAPDAGRESNIMTAMLVVLGVIALIVVAAGGCAVSKDNELISLDTEWTSWPGRRTGWP
jgi:hypothetical protein